MPVIHKSGYISITRDTITRSDSAAYSCTGRIGPTPACSGLKAKGIHEIVGRSAATVNVHLRGVELVEAT